MKLTGFISRVIVGLVFIFSGFVKAVDPLGFAYKFSDYLDAWNIEFFSSLALPLAVFLITLEFVVGIVILLGIRIKFFSWILLILSSFFFLLTLYIAIFNPVTDCGCFGDFLIISNWHTFFKNVILLALTIVIFLQKEQYKILYRLNTEWTIVFCFAMFIFGIQIYSLRHLPVLDFRPYNVGADIASKMEIPEGAPSDEYITYLYYKKNGVIKEFSDREPYPWNDSTWTFVKSNSVLYKKGYVPAIHDFVIENEFGEDITDQILTDNEYSFLLISNKIKDNKANYFKEAEKYSLYSEQNYNFSFYAVTNSINEEIKSLKNLTGIEYNFCSADNITLKTIIRSNPGLVLLKNGVVIGKWHYNDFPDINEINEKYNAKLLNDQRLYAEKSKVFNIFLLLILGIIAGRYLINKYDRA